MMRIEDIIDHIRNRDYMSGVERDMSRVKETEECFTHTWIVQKGLEEYEKLNPDFFKDINKTWIDNSCGDGQWLGEVLIKKLEYLEKQIIEDTEFEQALASIYGIDLMISNVDVCRERLLCGRKDQYLIDIVEKNIQRQNGLTYGYTFEAMGPKRARAKDEQRKRNKEKRDKINRDRAEEKNRQTEIEARQELEIINFWKNPEEENLKAKSKTTRRVPQKLVSLAIN